MSEAELLQVITDQLSFIESDLSTLLQLLRDGVPYFVFAFVVFCFTAGIWVGALIWRK